MKCDDNLVTWPEIVERCESIQRMRDYGLAHERSISLLQILNDMLSMSNSSTTRSTDEHDDGSKDRRSRSSTSMPREKSANAPSSSILHTHEALHDKEARTRASLQLRELPFIPIKQRPTELSGMNLTWMGDKYSKRLFKPKDVLSQQFEQLVGCAWPIAEQSKNGHEQIILTKQVEHFLGLDDTSKIELKDVLKQLDDLSKLAIVNGPGAGAYNHTVTSKYVFGKLARSTLTFPCDTSLSHSRRYDLCDLQLSATVLLPTFATANSAASRRRRARLRIPLVVDDHPSTRTDHTRRARVLLGASTDLLLRFFVARFLPVPIVAHTPLASAQPCFDVHLE